MCECQGDKGRTCDGSCYVSTWLGRGAQMSGQTLRWMFLWVCFGMRFAFELVGSQ